MTRIRHWAGWIGGIAGWALSDQAGSELAQFDCVRAHPGVMIAIGLAGLAIVAAGCLAAWPHWRRETRGPDIGMVHRFIAGTGLLAGAIFALAIVFQTVAALIIPQCHA